MATLLVLMAAAACNPSFAPGAARETPAAQAPSAVPDRTRRDTAFRMARIEPILVVRKADEWDRDLLYVRAQKEPPAKVAERYPWLTARQVAALQRAIARLESAARRPAADASPGGCH